MSNPAPLRRGSDPVKTCALCGHVGPYLGGRAGNNELCHRDHTNGRTCYERVTSASSLGRVTFEDAIKKIRDEKEAS